MPPPIDRARQPPRPEADRICAIEHRLARARPETRRTSDGFDGVFGTVGRLRGRQAGPEARVLGRRPPGDGPTSTARCGPRPALRTTTSTTAAPLRPAVSSREPSADSSNAAIEMASHPEDAEAGLRDRRVEGGLDAERQDPARVERIDDAVVPQPRRREVRRALALVRLEDRRLEGVARGVVGEGRRRPSRGRGPPAGRP